MKKLYDNDFYKIARDLQTDLSRMENRLIRIEDERRQLSYEIKDTKKALEDYEKIMDVHRKETGNL